MKNTMCLIFTISFLLSACGVTKGLASDDVLTKIYNDILIETINDNKSDPESDYELELKTSEEPKKEESIEQKILEPFIIVGGGHKIFTMNYQINVISLCGAVKQMEYEHDDEEDIHNINMHRFANIIYDKMNDDNIPIGFQRGRISDEIIELARFVETLEFKNCQEPHPGDRRDYYIIIGVDENRYAVHVGCGVYPCYQTDELSRAINEYIKTTTGQILN